MSEGSTMTTIQELKANLGTPATGQFTLLQGKNRTTRFGCAYKELLLADYTGSVRVYVWDSQEPLNRIPTTTPMPIEATLCARKLDNWVVANLQSIHKLDTHEIANAAALQPRKTCPIAAQSALDKLVRFVTKLEPVTLRNFTNRVLLDPEVAPTLTTCKASQGHHHSQPGGLLIHSVEVLEITSDMIHSRLTPIERSITEVAALLHDLGKLRAVGSAKVRPIHCQLVSHEAQTARMLDPHLQWLRAREPAMAAGLDYILEFLAHPATGRGYAKFLGADLVRAADRMSAALCNRKRLHDLVATTLPVEATKSLSIHNQAQAASCLR